MKKKIIQYNSDVVPNTNLPFQFIDKNGMYLRRNKSWDKNGDHGKGDSLFMTSIKLIESLDPFYLNSIRSCFKPVYLKNNKSNELLHYQVYRYPVEKGLDNHHWDTSRDQAILALVAFIFTRATGDFVKYSEYISKQISLKYKMTYGMKLWIKSVYKKLPIRYTLYKAIGIIVYSYLSKFARLIGNIKSYPNVAEYVENRPKQNRWQKFLINFIQPAYARELTLWQIYVMKDSICKRVLQRLMLIDTERSNYLHRLLCEEYVSQSEIDSFKPTTTYRWGIRLDVSNDRSIDIIKPSDLRTVANRNNEDMFLDYDILHRIYNFNKIKQNAKDSGNITVRPKLS